MNDEEIRLAIAKAKGWTVLPMKIAPCWTGSSYIDLPQWSTDMADAWKLVEEMHGYAIKKLGPNEECTVVLYPESNILRGQVSKDIKVERAICLAWLACQGAKHD